MNPIFHRVRATFGIAITCLGSACGSSDVQCRSLQASSLQFSGAVAIPDSVVTALVIEICVDSFCASTASGADAPGPTVYSDGGGDSGTALKYSLSGSANEWGYVTLTLLNSGHYQVQGSMAYEMPPDASTQGLATVTISGGGSVIYQIPAPGAQATCTHGMQCIYPYENCALTL